MLKTALLAASLCVAGLPAFAQDQSASLARTTFYIGIGSGDADGPNESDRTPFSIGLMHQLQGRKLILGADIGREGTLLDSTWGQNQAVKQATSYNLLLGANIVESERFRTDAALLLGVRENTTDCPASYLGYQCYANSDPDTEYKANIGAVVNFSFDRLSLGVRATGESTQLLAGFRF